MIIDPDYTAPLHGLPRPALTQFDTRAQGGNKLTRLGALQRRKSIALIFWASLKVRLDFCKYRYDSSTFLPRRRIRPLLCKTVDLGDSLW
jgi:hypothetical protein